MNTHQPVVSVSDLRMRYGKREALAGLSFEVHRGELFALLGPEAERLAVVTVGALVSQGSPHSLVNRQGSPTITFTLPAGLTAADLPEPARHAVCGSSGGMIGSLSQLMRGAAILAIQDGTERVTQDLLDLVPVDHAAQRSSTRRPGRRVRTVT